MAYLSMVQVASYCKQAGFSGNALITATAVAMAESSNSTTVINYLGCVGLFQIYGKVHRRTYKHWTNSWLQQPANNAKAAYILSNGGKNWRPWEAYTRGMHRKYLARAAAAVRSVPAVIPTKTTPATVGVTAAKVLSIASSQIGYRESPSGSNRTKYWSDLGTLQGQPWCGGFVVWCLWKAGYSLSKIKSMAGPNPYHVWTIMAYAKKKGRWSSTAKPGYLAIFTYSHVELVEKVVSRNVIQTIGGNTASGNRGSQNNGGMVARRQRSRSSIRGFVRIDYDAGYVSSPGATPIKIIVPTAPDWSPVVDQDKVDIDKSGQLTVDGTFNLATSGVLAKYFGLDMQGTETSAAYWKKLEAIAGFPVRWQNGKIDTETVQWLQWATNQPVNGVYNSTFLKRMQTFLNEFTSGSQPSYASMIAGATP